MHRNRVARSAHRFTGLFTGVALLLAFGCANGEFRPKDPFDRGLSFNESQHRYTVLVRWSEVQKAKAFVAEQPSNVRIGVVSFAGTAAVVQVPTHNREDIIGAIDRFQLQRGTAIGSGIIVSLATIFPDAGIDVSALIYGSGRYTPRGMPLDQTGKAETKEFKPVPPGSYGSAAIILLTDGQRTTGPDSLEAARMAADRGVRVFTVGFGTKAGETIGFEGWSMRVRLDEETLKAIADLTRGQYFYAGTATDLKKVYDSLNSKFLLEKKEMEITALFAAAAAITALVSALLSLLWFNRIL